MQMAEFMDASRSELQWRWISRGIHIVIPVAAVHQSTQLATHTPPPRAQIIPAARPQPKQDPAKEKAFSARIGHASGDSACDCATLSPQSALRATNLERAAWNHDSVDAGGPKRHQSRRCEDQEGSPRIAPMATNHPLIPRTAPGASEPHEIHLVLHPSPKLPANLLHPPNTAAHSLHHQASTHQLLPSPSLR